MFRKTVTILQFKTTTMSLNRSKSVISKLNRSVKYLKVWGLSGMAYGVTGFVILCYMTEWRTVLQYVPYYNGKYAQITEKERLDDIQTEAENKERHENATQGYERMKEEKQQKENNSRIK
ncbi:uncharacterized protein LOC126894019 [Daktulosphaira vitifoliae]|uniref:uncharacterized protein LOC126894019 n=1 Tax=Daktulosphaira vitifoliae TaxID=58002 RepID=UPI0021AA05B8|nr:uncharacterized protein LOC126894019 [Daktulosphaira vitifoliae]XP_050520601.1 uncharacterized protein LOC126894019 [Daktulosphaira vitifoliae]XP_050520602.1 uncharacterized protein LOC126894019 [Daktulosphaira vitifoliae]